MAVPILSVLLAAKKVAGILNGLSSGSLPEQYARFVFVQKISGMMPNGFPFSTFGESLKQAEFAKRCGDDIIGCISNVLGPGGLGVLQEGVSLTEKFLKDLSAKLPALRPAIDTFLKIQKDADTLYGGFEQKVLAVIRGLWVSNGISPIKTSTRVGDPIILHRGEFEHTSLDLIIGGAGIDFALRRTYRSSAGFLGPLGSNWDHSYNLRLHLESEHVVVRLTGQLSNHVFIKHSRFGTSDFNYYVPPNGVHDILIQDGSSFILKMPQGITYKYEVTNQPDEHRIKNIKDRFGNRLDFLYTTEDKLQVVYINSTARYVKFNYDEAGRLNHVEDHKGRSVVYSYNDWGLLEYVVGPVLPRDTAERIERYEYAFVGNTLRLIRVWDWKGRIVIENEYEQNMHSEFFGYVIRQSVNKGESNYLYESAIAEADPTLPANEMPFIKVLEYKRNGHKVEHILNEYGNELYRRERYLEGCGIREAVTRQRYNADGVITAKLNPDGVMTQFLYGRDHLSQSFQWPDLEHVLENVPMIDRMNFGNLLVKVTRGKRIFDSSEPFQSEFWKRNITDSPEDHIKKYHYHRASQLLLSESDPRFTLSTDPLHNESSQPGELNYNPSDPRFIAHQKHLTRFEYGSEPRFELKKTILPDRSRPSTAIGRQSISGMEEIIYKEFNGKVRPKKRVDANGYEWFTEYFTQDNDHREGFIRKQLIPHVDWVLDSEMPNILEITKHGLWQSSDISYLSSGSINEHITIKLEGVRIALYQSKNLQDKVSNNSQVEVRINGVIQPTWDQVNENEYVINNISRGVHQIELRDISGTPVSLGRIRSHLPIEYEVDELGQVIRETDARGNETVNNYNVFGQKIKIETGSSVTHFDFDPQGNLLLERTEWRDERGSVQPGISVLKQSKYDQAGNLLSETIGPEANGRKRTTQHRYGPEDNLCATKNPRGIMTFFHYDSLNRQTRIDRAAGSNVHSVTSTMYNNAGQILFRKTPRGGIYLHGFYTPDGKIKPAIDTLGRVLVETDPLGHLVVSDYDKLNNVVVVRRFQLRDDGSHEMLSRIENEYDEQGDLIQVTTAIFESPIRTANPKIPTQVDREFNLEMNKGNIKLATTEYHLDAFGNRIALKHSNGGIQNQKFDGQGLVYSETDAEGNRLFRIFDGNGNVVRQYTFDQVRNLNIPDELSYQSFVELFEYDELNREVARIDSYGNSWLKKYDSLGNLTVTEDPLGNVIRYSYSAFGEKISEIKELTQTGIGGSPISAKLVSNHYFDENGNLQAIEDAAQRRTEFRYDALDRQIESWFAVNSNEPKEYRSYDSAGNLLSITNRNGLVKHMQYDLLDRHFRTDINALNVERNNALSEHSPSFLSFQYDVAGNLTLHENNYCKVEITRDSRGLPTSEEISIQGISGAPEPQKVLRSFDSSGRREKIEYPSGRKIKYTFDKLDRIKSIQDALDGADLATYNYVGQRLSQVDYGNRLLLSIRHDGRGFVYERVVSNREDQVLWRNQSLRDGASYTRLENKSGRMNDASRKFSYDSIYRLTHYVNLAAKWFEDHNSISPPLIPLEPIAARGQSLIDGFIGALRIPSDPPAFEFDTMGNRTDTKEPGLAAIKSEPNNLNQYNQVNSKTWSYDLNGNLREDNEFKFAYDLNNSLQEVIQKDSNAPLVVYFRDALGRVIAEKGAESTFHIYDNKSRLTEISESREKEFTLGHSSSVIVHVIWGGADYWITQDGLNSVRLITNREGRIISIPAYRPFGKSEDGELGLSPFHLGFAGMWYSPDLPFYHSQKRSYRADLGRHFQRDPAGFIDDLNLYTYAFNNPTNYVDPLGLKAAKVGLGKKSVKSVLEIFQGDESIDRVGTVLRTMASELLEAPRNVQRLQNLLKLQGAKGAIRASEAEIWRNIQQRFSIDKTVKLGLKGLGVAVALPDFFKLLDGAQTIGDFDYEKAGEIFFSVARLPGGEKIVNNILDSIIWGEAINVAEVAEGRNSLIEYVTIGLPNTIDLITDLVYEITGNGLTPETERFRMDPSILGELHQNIETDSVLGKLIQYIAIE